MAKYFVSNGTIDATPDDNNDGRDPIGFDLSGAEYDDIDGGHGEGNYRLYDSGGAFSSYTWTSGDQIYITGTSVTDGLYEIASKVDSQAILLAESAGSDDSSVSSSDGPWSTIQYGVDNTEAGDELVICGASDYALSAQVDFDTQTSTSTTTIYIWGATARGVIDGTRATLDFDTQTSGNGLNHTAASNVISVVISNLNIENAYGSGIFLDDSCAWYLNNCRITGCGTDGVLLSVAGASITAFGCEFDDNTVGVNCDGSSCGPAALVNCRVHDNSSHGVVWPQYACYFAYCLIYNNGGDGAQRISGVSDSAYYHADLVNCTFFENGGDGIDFVDTTNCRASVTGCVFRTNTYYAIDVAGESDNVAVVSNCCFHNNGSGVSDVALRYGGGNIFVNPEFESETNGSEDFTPDSDSPLLEEAAGWAFSEGGTQALDIGAIQRELSGAQAATATTASATVSANDANPRRLTGTASGMAAANDATAAKDITEMAQYDDTTSIHTCLNTATQGTTLNEIAADARAISNSTGDLDNSTDLDLFGDFELDVTLGAAPTDGDAIAELYLLPSVDGTQFPTGSTSITPASKHFVGTFIATGTGTGQIDVIRGVDLCPRENRFLLVAKAALSAADTHTLKVKPYCTQ